MSEPGLLCPRCDRALAPFNAFESSLHRCETCEGVWVPNTFVDAIAHKPALRTRLAPMAARVEVVAAAVAGHGKPAHCAECRSKLDRFEAGGSSTIILDRCRAHGTWFDKDELGRVVGYMQSHPKAELIPAAMRKDKKPPRVDLPHNSDGSDAVDAIVAVASFLIDVIF